MVYSFKKSKFSFKIFKNSPLMKSWNLMRYFAANPFFITKEIVNLRTFNTTLKYYSFY